MPYDKEIDRLDRENEALRARVAELEAGMRDILASWKPGAYRSLPSIQACEIARKLLNP